MEYVARVLSSGAARVGSVHYGALFRWALARFYLLCGVAVFLVGVVFFPLPIPLGVPLMALGVVIVLNTSVTAKKIFARWSKRHPDSVGRLRGWIKERRRAVHRRRSAERAAERPQG
jgi:hypothetical protein